MLNQGASQAILGALTLRAVMVLLVTCSFPCCGIKPLSCGGVRWGKQPCDAIHLKYFAEVAFSKNGTSLWPFCGASRGQFAWSRGSRQSPTAGLLCLLFALLRARHSSDKLGCCLFGVA